jgi:hypothetical protein
MIAALSHGQATGVRSTQSAQFLTMEGVVNLGVGTAVGVAIGAAIGVAMNNLPVGIVIGIGIGLAISLATGGLRKRS